MYLMCGTKARSRFLDITKLSHALEEVSATVPACTDVCNALIGKFGMHVFTGCDTTSAFAGQGKMTASKQMKSDKTYQEAYR